MPVGFAGRKRGEDGFRWYDEDLKPIHDKPLEDIQEGAGGVAPVRENDKWGLMGAGAQWRVAPRYRDIGPFSYGLASFVADGSPARHGFLTPDGSEIVIPNMTAGDCMGHFLYVVHSNGAPGFYTRRGKLIERVNMFSI
jgi:hypothetical protein